MAYTRYRSRADCARRLTIFLSFSSGSRTVSGGWPIDVGNATLGDKLKRLVPNSAWMLGFDNYTDNVDSLMKILRWHVDNHRDQEDVICSAISHPKFIGKHALSLMDGFVRRVRSEYGDSAQFCTYQDVFWDKLVVREQEFERLSVSASA